MYLYYIFIILFFIISLPRLLRWLAIVQQKEYRLKRLWSFIKSVEGRQELFKLLPKASDLTRTGLKRPVRTPRIYLTALGSIFIAGTVLWLVKDDLTGLTLTALALYVLLPLWFLFAVLPTVLISSLLTTAFLILAKIKLDHHHPQIIGITGSYGKSTTKLLLKEVLATKQAVYATPLSYNTKYSIARSILKDYHGEKIVIIEYAAYNKGEIKTLTHWFKPHLAVITGFTPQHLGLFGSSENIIAAKSELVQALPSNATVFVNDKDAGAIQIANCRSDVKIIPVFKNEVIKLSEIDLGSKGHLQFKWDEILLTTNLLGRHYESNLRLAMAVGLHYEISKQDLIKTLELFKPQALVVTSRTNLKGALVIDDGRTANPKGFEAALELAKEVASKNNLPRRLLVTSGIVDLGNQSHQIHLELASKCHQLFDQVCLFGEVGSEEFRQKCNDKCVRDQDKIKSLLKSSGKDCLILIEGKMPKWIYQIL